MRADIEVRIGEDANPVSVSEMKKQGIAFIDNDDDLILTYRKEEEDDFGEDVIGFLVLTGVNAPYEVAYDSIKYIGAKKILKTLLIQAD